MLLRLAEASAEAAEDLEGDQRISTLEAALIRLRTVVREYPDSAAARALVAGGEARGLSLQALLHAIEATPADPPAPDGPEPPRVAGVEDAPAAPVGEAAQAPEADTPPPPAANHEPEVPQPRRLTLKVRLPRSGGAEAPRLGIRFLPDSRAFVSAMQPAEGSGFLLIEVQAGGAGEIAGLKRGDLLVAIGGRSATTGADLVETIRSIPSDIGVDAVVYRTGQGGDDLAAYLDNRSNEGSAGALTAKGDLARDGIGQPADLSAARSAYGRADDRGDELAPERLGAMYQDGLGVPKDTARAARYYRSALARGNRRAAYPLGQLYWFGDGVARDYAEAVRLMRMAAADGQELSYAYLGDAYRLGRGVGATPGLAVNWYRRAIEAGNVNAALALGRMYLNGQGISKDPIEARRLFGTASSAGIARADYYLGHIYRDGLGTAVNKGQALDYYRKAAEKGDRGATYQVGYAFFTGAGTAKNLETSLMWFERAAEAGLSSGHYAAAVVLSRLRPKDPTQRRAARHMLDALREGNDQASRAMKENAAGWPIQFRLRLQELLRQAGHYRGAIDGAFGPATRRAIDSLVAAGQ